MQPVTATHPKHSRNLAGKLKEALKKCAKTLGVGKKAILTDTANKNYDALLLQGIAQLIYPLVAQLDNAADSDSEERGFESLQAGQS